MSPVTITPELVLKAYAAGYFPMAEGRDDEEIVWVDPKWRGVLPLNAFHIPRRLQRTVRQERFTVTADTAFDAVIAGCASREAGRRDTWINAEIKSLYGELFRLGFAHSVESWHEGRLVGGLYGVALGRAFFGESMFSLARDASKVALVHLVARLKVSAFALLDTQFITDHLRQFGATEISRDSYRHQLEQALEGQAKTALFAQDFSGAQALSLAMAHSAAAEPPPEAPSG